MNPTSTWLKGRPPRTRLDFQSASCKTSKNIPSDRMLVRQMWKDPRLKRICDIEADESPLWHCSTIKVQKQSRTWKASENSGSSRWSACSERKNQREALALDSTFIKAYSRRNLDNRTGYSDPESRIGRAVKAKDLGYRLHLAFDVKANCRCDDCGFCKRNEKKHSITLFRKASSMWSLEASGRFAVQRSKSKRKRIGSWSIAGYPYPRNQCKGVKGILRVDRKFRSHGPQS